MITSRGTETETIWSTISKSLVVAGLAIILAIVFSFATAA